MSISSPPSPGAVPRPRFRPAVSRPQALAALGLLLLGAALWRLRGAAGHPLWLDELYTTTLIDTPRLGHVWSGAMRGVDGNPPLYLSLGWLLTQVLPGAPEQVLRGLNLAILSLTAVLLYRIGRRVADPASVVAGLTILCGLDGAVVYALLEIRTYALYLLLVTATLWAALRVVDRPARWRVAALAGIGVLATLAHSFGGFYVLGILGAGALVALVNRDRALFAAMAVAALPAAATLLLWIRLSLAAQLAVATPYGWIPVPGIVDLVAALSGSILLTPLLGAGLLAWALRAWAVRRRPGVAGLARACRERRDRAVIVAALSSFAALTLAGWIGSHLITPFFVPRYFIPNVAVAALLLVGALSMARCRVDRALFGLVVAAGVATGTAAVAVDAGDAPRPIPCRDASGRFLEEGLAGEGLPVVAESPHAWFPRSRYAPSQTTLYPLDWDVVLRFPTRARNNAMDFHIMEILRDWAAPGSALSTSPMATEAILLRYPHILVLDEASRSWFAQLKSLRPVSARLVREGEGCRLWDVTLPAAAG